MSSVSEQLQQRGLASGCHESADAAEPMTLADLDRGQRATVIGYDDGVDASTARRLFDLGLAPGTEVAMVRRAPLRDPVIYRVGDYDIALRRAQSRCIRVQPTR